MRKIKKLICTILMVGMILSLSACRDKKVAIDYADAESFEVALNNGDNLEGKVVQFVAGELHPDSAFGYDIWAGEHLNFVSSSHPNIKEGDTVVVRATKIESKMGSWILTYEKVSDAVVTESTISSNGAEQKVDTSTETEAVIKNNERTQKDGFDENTNSIVNMSTFSISVPQYWDADITESNSYRAYAEKSGKAAMLQIISSYDNEDPVTFEILKEENDNGKMASVFESWYDSCGEVESELFDNGHVKGYIYKCTFTEEGNTGNSMCLFLPSVDDNSWVSVVLTETDNTEYLYDSDYRKILNSIEESATSFSVESSSSELPLELVDYGWFFNDPSGDTAYVDFCGMIKNPNEKLVAQFPKILVTVKNGDGSILATEEQVGSVVMPGDTITLCGMFPMLVSDISDDAKIVFDVDWSEFSTDTQIYSQAKTSDFVITNVSERNGSDVNFITGEITNNFTEDVDQVNLSIVLRKDGKIVFMENTFVDGLKKGKTKAFEFQRYSAWPEHDTIDVSAMVW